MTADQGWAVDRDHAGFVAGFLASASLFGRCLTSSMWGFVVCRVGYKVAMIVALTCIALGGLTFAFASGLWAALAVRFLFLGVGNGWVSLMGPICMEFAGPERQADLLGMVMSAGSFTQLFGPAVAGYTYGTFKEHPAAVPSLLGTFFALITLIMTCLWVSPSAGIYETVPASETTTASGDPSATSGKKSIWQVLTSWPMPLIVAMRFLSGMSVFAVFEVVPLWLIASRDLGGLGFDESGVGNFLARSAIWNMVYFTFIMPRGSKWLGVRRFAIVSGVISAASCAVLPFVYFVPLANCLHAIAATTSIATGAMATIATNNSVPADQRSQVCGIVVFFETCAKALGPIVTTNLFAWTLTTWGDSGHYITFFALSASLLLYALGAVYLPSAVNQAPEQAGAADASPEMEEADEEVGDIAPAKLGSPDPHLKNDDALGAVDASCEENLDSAARSTEPIKLALDRDTIKLLDYSQN
eukprot:TRINITY_DN19021_c0_g1_i1.p1 TRINITY_DN19021_c0_g1~~TRINITY_DN19021_c0_g1_i1.p1  ORF type:complete len:531 (+),score=54.12 TRINITY_DN19021_c0_g1_i1:179-1594(+)